MVDAALNAARMLPMMSPRRSVVMVRAVERWEKKDDEDAKPKKGVVTSPLDALADYAKAPVDSAVLVLVASKLHGQRRLVTAAKKGGFLVACEQLHRRDLPGWITRTARAKGHAIDGEVAELLAAIAGPELGYVADAIERLSLFVGEGAPITEDAVATIVTKVRQSTVWELLDGVTRRRLDHALGALGDVLDPRDGGLRLLATIGWSVKQMIKFESAMRAGASPNDAAARAGMPPFRAQGGRTVAPRPPARHLSRRGPRSSPRRILALKGSGSALQTPCSRRS